ncbi:MAG: hypothetical protein LBP65_01165 [Puniceicoccales bacterium]|jgi:hypothetical protein|nr:hypothetical protein [Puniceicoccales bacterium]
MANGSNAGGGDDSLQQLKRLLSNYATGLERSRGLDAAPDRFHYVVAKAVSQLIGDGEIGPWIEKNVAAAKAMTPSEFDAYVEAIEQEHGIVLVDEIDRWMERGKALLSKHVSKKDVAEKILRTMLLRHGDGDGDLEPEAGNETAADAAAAGEDGSGRPAATGRGNGEKKMGSGTRRPATAPAPTVMADIVFDIPKPIEPQPEEDDGDGNSWWEQEDES